ncbi:MAG: N-acetylmuramoyl-L-alanine amidase [Bacteroidales bacterium]|jgi:N-acetylmuramoyl-L-alanine amidase|nr:N-acetylmuramoyl-L-alanine amidase [Bacteroidales bacterium]
MKLTGSQILLSFSLFLFTSALIAQQPIKVKAKSGDGIHRILKQHQMDTEEYYHEFIRLNKTKLIKGNLLFIGRTYILPQKNANTGTNYYAIFGEKYGHVKNVDNSLQGAVYYLVSGHGGPDPGAVGKRDGHLLTEDEYAYDISLRLAVELIKQGAIVYIIVRDPDDGIRDDAFLKNDKHETVWKDKEIPLNINKKLRQRTQVVNQLYRKNRGQYQRLIVIHIDSRSKGERVDVFGYYNSKSKSGKIFTERLISALKLNYKKYQPKRLFGGITNNRDGLYMLKYTHPVTSYLELGNIQNAKDQVRFTKSENRQALAEWLAEGCISDFDQ